MEAQKQTIITVENTINVPVSKAWEYWTRPEHIIQWNNANADWCTPSAKNDLREGGNFVYRMEAKDGSMGFDFGGVYDSVREYKSLEYTIGDGRKVKVNFADAGDSTRITESFEAEHTNSIELQKGGWQAILDNFKRYAEAN